MGLFDFLRPKKDKPTTPSQPMSHAEFARTLMDGLQAASVEGLSYDEKDFSIFIAQSSIRFFLGNAYAEYLAAKDGEARFQIIARYVTIHAQGIPKPLGNWETVAPNLLPIIRTRATLHRLGAKTFEEAEKQLPWQVVGESLGLCLGHDTPTSMSYVNHAQLRDWDIDFNAAMAKASENLLARSSAPFQQLAPGVFRSSWKDNYDPSRLVIPEVLTKLALKGRPVITVPHWNALLVTGSEDVQGLIVLAEVTKEEIKQPRTNTCMAYVLSPTGWVPYLPEPDHPAYLALLTLDRVSFGREYADATGVLRKQYEGDAKAPFIAKYSLAKNETTQRVFSWAQWSNTVDTLLPKADFVLLYNPELPEKQAIMGSTSWDQLATICPELGQPVEGYPLFYHPSRFPDAEALSRIQLGPMS